MIEELPSHGLAYRFTHELVRRALYDRLSGMRRAELHLRVGEALESAGGALGPGARRPRAPLRRRRALRRGPARGVEYNVLAARAATAALAFDEAATRLRTALELGIRASPPARRGVQLELGDASHRGGKATRCAGGVQGGGGDRPRAGGRGAARAGRDRLRGRLLAPGDRRPGRGRAARGGDSGARRRRAPSCGSGCWPGSPARSTSRATTSAGRSSARAPSAWRGSSRIAPGSPRF